MKLTELEIKVILEEAEKAKNNVFSTLTLGWQNGILNRAQIVTEVNKDELKARLDPNPIVREVLSRGGKPLTPRSSGA